MPIKHEAPLPKSHGITIRLDSEAPDLAQNWAEQCADDLASALDNPLAETLNDLYRDAAQAAHRWYVYQINDRRRLGLEVPQVKLFEVVYFSEPAQRGSRLAVIDVLTGKVRRT